MTKNPGKPENPFLAQWLETTRAYLFAQPQAAGTNDDTTANPHARLQTDTPGRLAHTGRYVVSRRTLGAFMR